MKQEEISVKTKSGDPELERDVYYVLMVGPAPDFLATYTSPIHSRMVAERHADALVRRGYTNVEVVRRL